MRTGPLCFVLVCFSCSADVDGGARFDPDAPRRVIESTPACPECEIRLREVARLGRPADPTSIAEGALTTPCAIGRLSTGQYVAVAGVGGGQILVYAQSGQVLRTIGREGRGPREFGSDLRIMVGPGDTLQVLDNSNLRVTTLTASGEFIGSFRIPGRLHSHALLNGGMFLFHGRPLGTPSDDRSLFRLLNRSGVEIVQFADPSVALAGLDQWILGPAHPNGFWTASLWTYELYRWGGPDSLLWTLVREGTPWFPRDQDLSDERFDNMYEAVPPPSSLWHLYEAQGDHLWVYAWVPDENWKPGAIQTPPPEWTREKLDTMVEVIDLAAHPQVIARRRHDRVLSPVCGSDLMFTVVYAEMGDTRAVVLQPELRRPPEAR